jgi:RNA polymerase sigma-54 factor
VEKMALQIGYGLIQEQRMKLVMTPELRQAIQLLQLSAADLEQYIHEQLEENPVLEIAEPGEGEDGEEAREVPLLDADPGEWMAYVQRNGRGERGLPRSADEGVSFESLAAPSETLADALESQLRYLSLDSATMAVCRYLIGNLDDNGYLTVDAAFLCKRFNIDRDTFDRSLRIIQSLEPAGVGARSLSECLKLQLQREDAPDEVTLQIIQHHLDDVAAGRIRKIARQLGVGLQRVQQAVDRLKRLNPRPGMAYASSEPRYVLPDVCVERVNGEYVVLVNEGFFPRLTVSDQYQRMMAEGGERARQAADYLRNWFQSAVWLVRGIEQRRQTLYRVTRVIVEKQRDFLDRGVDHLKPLTLREVADELGLHESTVSRATQNKYVQTPRGLFPFRYFFPSGVDSLSGDISAKSVKKRIVELIQRENKQKPLSDQRIADLLREGGIRISRRTVAKYREELGIASSMARRRYDKG